MLHPKPGQVYLTGKATLHHRRLCSNNRNALLYDGTVAEKRSTDTMIAIHSVYQYTLHLNECTPSDGLYNISAKVLAMHASITSPKHTPQVVTFDPILGGHHRAEEEELLFLYGEVIDVHTFLLTFSCILMPMLSKMTPIHDDVVFEHATQISGKGWVASSNPFTHSFVVHTSQNLTRMNNAPVQDIMIRCVLNKEKKGLRSIEDLPLPTSLV